MPPEYEEAEDRVLPEKISCIDGRIKNSLRFAVTNTFYGRRAMVNKFWCHEVARKWFHKKEDPPHARSLSEPKCQDHASTWYLIYRWLIFIAWTIIIVCSIFEIGSYRPLYAQDKWPIYLTNWDLLLGLSQALFGGIVVSRRWKLQRIPGFDPSTLKLASLERIYWFLYVVTVNVAIGITVSYWVSVYNPKIHDLDPLNVMSHICNSILMVLDFCVTSIPFRLRNFWWCLTIVICYIIFSVIYYLAGGLDKYGNHYIYKILDWKKPIQTIFICVGEIIFVTILHFAMYLLDRVKDHYYFKLKKSQAPRAEVENKGPNVEKRADIV